MQQMRQAIQSYVGRGFNLKTMKRILTFILAIIGSVSIYAQDNIGLKSLMLFSKVRFNMVDFVLTTSNQE